MKETTSLGVSGRIAAAFQSNALTPLLAIVALLLGVFAVLVTPREEEPQINVTMANVLIPFPGASSVDVQNMVARPAEQALSQNETGGAGGGEPGDFHAAVNGGIRGEAACGGGWRPQQRFRYAEMAGQPHAVVL